MLDGLKIEPVEFSGSYMDLKGEEQPRDAETGKMVPIVDNVHERDSERPTGNTAVAAKGVALTDTLGPIAG